MATTSLETRLGYTFGDRALLERALTHRSFGATHNERLEFLGDSVLNCAVAAMLHSRFDHLNEGELSRTRANLVKQQTLHEIASRLGLSGELRLGAGELRSGGAARPSILADALEAVVGAVFLDAGFDAAMALLERLYQPLFEAVDIGALGKDPKTRLQEFTQARQIDLPVYTVVGTHGAQHDQAFDVQCTIPALGLEAGGQGSSRRAAEQAAARVLLERLAGQETAAKPAGAVSAAGAHAARRAAASTPASVERPARRPAGVMPASARPTLRRPRRSTDGPDGDA